MTKRKPRWIWAAMACCVAVVSAGTMLPLPVPTTLLDFFQPGSQPTGGVVYESFISSNNCKTCHEFDDETDLWIYSSWQGSMMAQAARDPLFFASLAIANQDASFAGDLCLRCHTPGGWISGRSEPTDGSALISVDRDGVSCSVCHRLVDPVFTPGKSPPIDEGILADIDPLPASPGGGNFVLDPNDLRRGPYDDAFLPGHSWVDSPFLRDARICGTCHDVSNPVFLRQADDTYVLTPLDEAHPTADKYDMFPLERTFSEWLHSDFAAQGVDMGGRFGGNITVVRTCQDCHMPKTTGKGCNQPDAPIRDDLGMHELAGGNAWAQDMVLNLYPDDNLNPDHMQAGKAAAISMLQRASTLEATQTGAHLDVRVVNETGHKLPSGYPEGRRMWINVQQFDGDGAMIEERGHYNVLTADLTTNDTRVYEIRLGLDADVAAATGVPEGEGLHFALNNVVMFDNRIPPRGFTNDAFEAIQSAPIGAAYADGQHWSDTAYALAPDATSVAVNLYYQSASKEFITFLRDENITNDAGDVLYEQWELTGKSPPVLMASETVTLGPFATGDADGDGDVDLDDFSDYSRCAGGPNEPFVDPDCVHFDFDADADVDGQDFGAFQTRFGE